MDARIRMFAVPRHMIIDSKALIKWKISLLRRDKRTGATGCRPMSDYAKKQYKDAMRRWFS